MNQLYEKESTAFFTKTDGNISSPAGFFAGGLHCGIKRKRPDLGWLYSAVPAQAAAVYTTNQFQAAPIQVTKESIVESGKLSGIIVNSGNANSFTGSEGLRHARLMRKWFAAQIGVNENQVGVASTGVIGEFLPVEKIETGIRRIDIGEGASHPDLFEKAILTTDTFQKRACATLEIGGKTVTVAGCAKGSGMIHPNMATMLAFMTTDAKVEAAALQNLLKQTVDETFNMITVDGDTSTNDMVIVMANGLAGNDTLSYAHPDWKKFAESFAYIARELAKQIARDGEGATKLVEVCVTGAETEKEAQAAAKTVIGSNLVKAAVFGADANWGRIINAIGYSGVQVDEQALSVRIGGISVVEKGMPASYSEDEAHAYLKENDKICIAIDLGAGTCQGTAWGCDLTYDYVKINATYRS